jgi:hypothetical protein
VHGKSKRGLTPLKEVPQGVEDSGMCPVDSNCETKTVDDKKTFQHLKVGSW